MQKKLFRVLLTTLAVSIASPVLAGPCDAFFNNSRGVIPGINAGTTLGALGRSALDKNANGNDIAIAGLIGTGVGEVVKIASRKKNQNKCEEALEDLCLDGENAACSQLRMLDRNRYHRVMDERDSGNGHRSNRRERDPNNDDRGHRQDSEEGARYERRQESPGNDYFNNVGDCVILIDGLAVRPGRGTRFTFRRSKVVFEDSGKPVDLFYSQQEDAFMPIPPRS